MNENQTRQITVSEITSQQYETGTKFKIKSTTGGTYNFYDKKQDGSNTMAYQQFLDMGIKVGSTVEIWFKEENKDWKGKPYVDRRIASFKEVGKTVLSAVVPPKLTEVKKSGGKDEDFWEMKAYKQCLWGYFLEHKKTSLTPADYELVWKAFKQIDQDAKKRFLGVEELPVIQQEEQINVEDIPF